MAQLNVAAIVVAALGLAGLVAGQALSGGPAPQNASARAATQPTTEPVVTDEKPVVSLSQLLAGARARREAIHDLSVMAEWKAIKLDPNADIGNYEHDHLVIKAEKIYLDKSYSFAKTRAGTTFRRLLAYDGTQSAMYAPIPPGLGRRLPPPLGMTKGLNREMNLGDNFFIELNLLVPPDAPGNHASLEHLLGDPQTRLRNQLQRIDGHLCYVIDDPLERKAVYIDAERGYVPLRWELLDRQGKPEIYAWTDQVIEVEKGIWVATHGYRHVAAMPNVLNPKVLDSELELEIGVDGWNTDHPALAVNSGVKDSFFDLPNRMPKGTEVVDFGADGRGMPRGAAKDTDPEDPIMPPLPDPP